MKFSRVVLKDINPDLLVEEVLSIGVKGVTFSGFTRTDERTLTPISKTTVVGSTTINGVKTEITAEPGQLDFSGDSDPGTSLDTILSSHDARQRTSGQAEKDSFDADRQLLRSELGNAQLSKDAIMAMARLVVARK